ncbi:prephenate dehydrogenase/arogenate dehydrogenase family protein [soil metagenome]
MNSKQTVAIIGVGLIGGSIGLALRSRGLADRVVGVGRDPGRLEEARRLGAVDSWSTDMAHGVAEAGVVVICTPVTRIVEDIRRAAESVPAGALITDAGSTKRRIVEQVEQHDPARSAFVGAHPLAGSERTGAAAARAELFEGRTCVLTPTPRTPVDRLDHARRFWQSLGCRIVELGLEEHDQALARTSHLPHAVAAALASAVPDDWLPLAAGAYRDGTRVAGADGALWAGIFLENRQQVFEALKAFQHQLSTFEQALARSDVSAIQDWWETARQRRQRFDDGDPGSNDLPPAGE